MSTPSIPSVPQPRVNYRPSTAVATFGPEAVALAKLAGLEADDWQAESIGVMLSFNADGKWTCPDYCELVARQNGKGTILEIRALAGLFLLGEKLITWTAHEAKTTDRAFRRFQTLIKTLILNGYLAEGDVKVREANGQQGFEVVGTPFRPAQELKFIARSKGSGRGFTGDCVIVDEAYDYTPAQASALEPTMLAIDNPQTIYTSTPPLSGDTGQPLYDLRARGESGTDDMLGYRDWGLGGELESIDALDVEDPELWKLTNPAYGKRITTRGIKRLLKKLGKTDFARESLGIWPRRIAEENKIIDVEKWDALADPNSEPDDDHGICVSFSVTARRDRASVAIAGLRPDGLSHWELIQDEPGVNWLVQYLVGLKARRNPKLFAVNGKGADAAFISDLIKAGFKEPEDREHPERGDLIIMRAQDVADAFAKVIDAVEARTVRHRTEPKLSSALAGATTRPIGTDGKAWKQGSANPIAPIEAVTQANWVEETWAHLLIEDNEPSIW